MHVDRPGAAEVVVAPDLLQQLVAGEDPTGMLGEVLEELELLEGEVEHAAADLRGVRRLVDDHLAGANDVRVGVGVAVARRQLADRDPDPGVDLGRPGRLEDDVVDPPVGGDDGQPAFRDDQHDRLVGPVVRINRHRSRD